MDLTAGHEPKPQALKLLGQGSATDGPRAITGPPDIISGPPDYSEVVFFFYIEYLYMLA